MFIISWQDEIYFLLYEFNSDFCFDLLLSLFISLFLFLLLSILILLFYYYYHILFLLVIIVIVLSIIDVVYFNLSHFISYCSYYYDFWLRVACDVYLSHVFSFPYFLVNGLHFMLALLMHVKNHFSLAIIVYIIIVIITTILFFSTLPPVIGGKFSNWIRAAWSTPTHWLLWVSRRVSIIFIFILFYFIFL